MASRKPHRLLSMRELTSVVDELHQECIQLALSQFAETAEVHKALRKMISVSNSVAIVLAEFQLWGKVIHFLKKVLSVDVLLFFEGTVRDRMWYHRPLTYAILGYVELSLNDLHSSLQFLYDAEALLMKINQGTPSNSAVDCSISCCMLTFLVLFRIGQYENAAKYLNAVRTEYAEFQLTGRKTRFRRTHARNLHGLVSIAQEVLTGIFEKKLTKAREVLAILAGQSDELASLFDKKCYQFADGVELVMSAEFQHTLFLTCFFPFINKNTPLVRTRDLHSKRNANAGLHYSYNALMKEAMAVATLY